MNNQNDFELIGSLDQVEGTLEGNAFEISEDELEEVSGGGIGQYPKPRFSQSQKVFYYFRGAWFPCIITGVYLTAPFYTYDIAGRNADGSKWLIKKVTAQYLKAR